MAEAYHIIILQEVVKVCSFNLLTHFYTQPDRYLTNYVGKIVKL